MKASAAPSTPETTSHLLWEDMSVFRRRYQKSANALVAVRNVLQERRPLEGAEDEFLSLYERLESADPRYVYEVWTDPTAYYWVRLAYQLLHTTLSGAPLNSLGQAYCREIGAATSAAALPVHLHSFKRYALGLAFLDGRELALASPLEVSLPFAIPGTELSLDGSGRIRVNGLLDGELSLWREGAGALHLPVTGGESEHVRLRANPVAVLDRYRLSLRHQAFNNLPGLVFVEPVLQHGEQSLGDSDALLCDALRLMREHAPDTFSQFSEVIRYIALKPLGSGDYTNISHSDLPGTFIASRVENPYELADTFIHELHHNRLFTLEETGPFFLAETTDPLRDALFYSPWRDDPRPLHGIYHAVYVFIPVCRYWFAVARAATKSSRITEYALSQVQRITAQLIAGVYQIERHADLTTYGERLFASMRDAVEELRAQVGSVGLTFESLILHCGEDGSFRGAFAPGTDHALTVKQETLRHVQDHAPVAQRAGILVKLRSL